MLKKKLCCVHQYLSFILQDRDTFSVKLEDTENWLYEEGEDQPKQVYIDKLADLKVKQESPINSQLQFHPAFLYERVKDVNIFLHFSRNLDSRFKTDTWNLSCDQEHLRSSANRFSST